MSELLTRPFFLPHSAPQPVLALFAAAALLGSVAAASAQTAGDPARPDASAATLPADREEPSEMSQDDTVAPPPMRRGRPGMMRGRETDRPMRRKAAVEKGFDLRLGPVRLRVACGEEPLEACLAAAEPLLEMVRTGQEAMGARRRGMEQQMRRRSGQGG